MPNDLTNHHHHHPNENDHENSCYYLRSKKRKTSTGEITTSSFTTNTPLKRKNPIMFLPFEVLQNILKFISFQELSYGVRSVNRKFKVAAEDLLNKSFRGLHQRIRHLCSTTLKAIEATNDDMEVKCLCRLLNLLDIMKFQQSVIMATIWRYVYNAFYRSSTACMYAGQILDIFDVILTTCATKPYQMYAPAVVKDYAVPEEVKNLIQLTKSFCIHFDKVIEEPMKHSMSVSGCKIVDLLDCADYATKSIIYESICNDSFSAKYSYFLHNAWFVAFGIPAEKEMTPKQKQRMMHMRIRRIILAHTEMFMQQSQYERELLLRTNPLIKRPSVVVYTGYGDVHDTFFCYGAMNDAAYLQKFHLQDDDQNDEDVEDEIPLVELFQQHHQPELVNNNDDNDDDGDDVIEDDIDDFSVIPHLGLDIDVRIDCPLAYAPLDYIKRITASEKNNLDNSQSGMFNLSIEFNCAGAYYPRLPPMHKYCKRISTRHH